MVYNIINNQLISIISYNALWVGFVLLYLLVISIHWVKPLSFCDNQDQWKSFKQHGLIFHIVASVNRTIRPKENSSFYYYQLFSSKNNIISWTVIYGIVYWWRNLPQKRRNMSEGKLCMINHLSSIFCVEYDKPIF